MYWYEKYGLDPELLGSPITPFGIKKRRDSVLYEKFMVAKDLFQLFKEGKIGADEIFDVKKMGRFMAIVDLFGHHHANGQAGRAFRCARFLRRSAYRHEALCCARAMTSTSPTSTATATPGARLCTACLCLDIQ